MNAADPILDQLGARWRDMSITERRCVARHIESMRQNLAIRKVVLADMAKLPHAGEFVVAYTQGELMHVGWLHEQFIESRGKFENNGIALVKHFADGDNDLARLLFPTIQAEFMRRTPDDMLDRKIARTQREVDSETRGHADPNG